MTLTRPLNANNPSSYAMLIDWSSRP
jgi:hypothetical protein